MRRVLVWSAAALGVLVVAAVAALALLDLSRYRSTIEARAGDALGRAVTIGGDLEISASLVPSLTATQVAIANRPGGGSEDMARVGRLEIGLKLLPLLDGEVRITHLNILEADIDLEVGADGVGNWVFEFGGTEAGSQTSPAQDTKVMVQRLELRDSVISYAGIGGTERHLEVERASVTIPSEHDEIAIEIKGAVADLPVEGTIKTGSLSALIAGEENWPVEMAMAYGDSRLSASGTIADPTTLTGYSLDIDTEVASVEPLEVLFLHDLPALPAFSFRVRLDGDPSEIRASEISATYGDSDVSGDLALSLVGERPALSGNLESRRLDLAGLSIFGSEKEADPDPAIPVGVLDLADIDLKITVEELQSPRLTVFGFTGAVHLADRHLEVDVPRARIFDGLIDAELSLDGRASPAAISVELAVSQVNLGDILRAYQIFDALDGLVDVSVKLAASGATRQALIASAGGRADFTMGAGRVNSESLELVGISALSALLPDDDEDSVDLHCAVAFFDIADGRATSSALLVDSENVTVAGEGAADLSVGEMDFTFKPAAKDPTFLPLVAPVRVFGEIDSPQVEVMTGDLVVRSASAVALGVISPLAIVIPLITAGEGDENPCLAVAHDQTDSASRSQAGGDAESQASQDGTLSSDAEDLLDSAGSGLDRAVDWIFGQ